MTSTKLTFPYRSEILFLYDAFRCNPNGDPFENRPRQDPTTGRIDVTDVRLKRTVRDYILRYKHDPEKGLDIFVRASGDEPLTAERRYEEIFGELPQAGQEAVARERLIDRCVDVRWFGVLVPITERRPQKERGRRKAQEEEGQEPAEGRGGGVQLTGAVQFNPGQSLHEVEVIEVAGTGGFTSRETARQRTFRREFIVPYALIGFYGVINERLARETGLTESDVALLMEALWLGTLSLHSRSKAFHHPRLLLRLDYEPERQCGYFLDRVNFLPQGGKSGREIRLPKDYLLDIEPFLQEVEKLKNYVQRVYCRLDTDLPLAKGDRRIDVESFGDSLVALTGSRGRTEFYVE